MRLQKHAGRLTLRLLDMDAMMGNAPNPNAPHKRGTHHPHPVNFPRD
jgi:hypothetical protein